MRTPPKTFVRIVTDCVGAIPQAEVRRLNIHVLPVYLMLNGRTVKDDGTIDPQWFYQELNVTPARPQTAAPAPSEFTQIYREAVDGGGESQEIVGIFTASSVSSIYAHACMAAADFQDTPIHLIDTQQVTMGQGWLAITAAEMAQAGASAPAIVERVTSMRARTHVFGVLDSPDYLRRSGRANVLQSYMASILSIKPMISFHRGVARMLDRVRTLHRALHRVAEAVSELRPLERLALIHSGAAPHAIHRLLELLQPFAPTPDIAVLDVGAVFATHVGPGAVGVALVAAE